MATGAQAADEIADELGVPRLVTSRGARFLREEGQDDDLWPLAKPGGGKGSAHTRIRHHVNLLLGTAAAQVVTEIVEVTKLYRSLVPKWVIFDNKRTSFKNYVDQGEWLPP